MTKLRPLLLSSLGALVAMPIAGCGGDDGGKPTPDILWLAPIDTDFNLHLVDERPFPY